MRLGFTIIPLVLVVAACGSSNNIPSTATSTPNSSSGVALSARNVKGLGTVLVNGEGRTLYTFAPDRAQKVTCTGTCAVVWTPLTVASRQKPSLSGGLKASLLSSDPKPSGGRVVTYNGWPLYLYQADPMAGTDHGQALLSSGGLWYAIAPAGTEVKKRVKNTTRPPRY